MWPLLTGANTTQPRPLTPVTEVSIEPADEERERQAAPIALAMPTAPESTPTPEILLFSMLGIGHRLLESLVLEYHIFN